MPTAFARAAVVANRNVPGRKLDGVIRRELAGMPLRVDVHPSVDDLRETLRYTPARAYSMSVIDGSSIDHDFTTLPAALKAPRIVMLEDDQYKKLAANDPQFDARNALPRSFAKGELRAAAERVLSQLPEPVTPLKGLFFDKACLNVFYNGRPITGLIDIDQDMLRFLVRNRRILTSENIGPLFAQQVQGITEETAPGALRTLSRRLELILPKETNGTYGISRELTADNKLLCCRVVRLKPNVA